MRGRSSTLFIFKPRGAASLCVGEWERVIAATRWPPNFGTKSLVTQADPLPGALAAES